MNDLRFALRQLLKNPGFTAVAVLTLALGIGANTAVFSALNSVLLRSLPVRNPQELRLVNWTGINPKLNSYTGIGMGTAPGGLQMGTSFPYPAYRAFRDHGAGFTDLFAFASKKITAVKSGKATTAAAMLVSGNFFSGYGTHPLIGRPIVPEDDRPGAAAVAIITYRWWEQHCGLDPNVLGQPIMLNQSSYTIIGVLPQHYMGPMMGDSTDIYVPMSAQSHLEPTRPLDSPSRWWIQIMGRFAPGANESQAQASLAILFRQVLGESNSTIDNPGILIEDGSRGQLLLRRQFAKPFLALTGVVILVLLIACANLAGLLLARGAARQHEMAVRAALGAGRWRLIRQCLIECLVLSIIGAGIGLGLARWLGRTLAGFLPMAPDLFRLDLRMDSSVFVFTAVVSVITALVFGFLPAMRASRVDPSAGLANRAAMGTPRLSAGRALVAMQVGLSVLLIFGAGLMTRTFVNLANVAPGFDPASVLLFQVRPRDAGYDGSQFMTVYDRIRTAVVAVPGVRAVTFSSYALVSGTSSAESVEFLDGANEAGRRHQLNQLVVGEEFFRTMNIPLVLGRDFAVTDTASSPAVAVVNEALVRRFFAHESTIGRTFLMEGFPDRKFQIVGVCRDAKYDQLRTEPSPLIYLSQRQYAQGSVCFEVRSALPPLSLVPAVRNAVAGVDPNLPLSRIRTQEQQMDQSLSIDRLCAGLGGAFALLALLLSCIGLYGLMAYNVARRTREIGLRLALGATRRNVAEPIIREALLIVLAGLSVGVPVALALTRLIKSQLYGVGPTDPTTLGIVVFVLLGVAAIAAWAPTRRATKVDPMEALRWE
jgi:predicted permease